MSPRELLIPEYGVHGLANVDLPTILDALDRSGWRSFPVLGSPSDKRGVFQAVIDAVPLDPPMTQANVDSCNWDALADSLVGGLGGVADNKIAIVWPDSWDLWHADRPTYETSRDILTSLVFKLAARRFPDDRLKRMLVLYV